MVACRIGVSYSVGPVVQGRICYSKSGHSPDSLDRGPKQYGFWPCQWDKELHWMRWSGAATWRPWFHSEALQRAGTNFGHALTVVYKRVFQ